MTENVQKEINLDGSVEIIFRWVEGTDPENQTRQAITLGLTVAAAHEIVKETEYVLLKSANGEDLKPSEFIDLTTYEGAVKNLAEAGPLISAKKSQSRVFDQNLDQLKKLLDKSETSARMIMQGVNNKLKDIKQPQLRFK